MLIAPNPESALNEDAGRLLLENYEAYAAHAKLWTSIHAQKPVAMDLKTTPMESVASAAENLDPLESPQKKSGKEEKGKKRSLKRL